MHNFKKVFYIVCLLLLLLVCYQNSHAALISKGVTYKAEFKPFGDSLKWQHSIPAEFESPIALGFEFFLSGGTLTAELGGNMSFDSETHIIALQGTSGRMHSDGGVGLGGDITINTTIPLSTFGEGASLPINYKQGIPEFPDISKSWDKSETFNSFLLSGSQPESVTMEVGIPKLVTEKISAVRLGMILGKAIVTRRAPIPKVVDQLIIDPLMDELVDYITEYVDGRIEVHGGLVGDLKLAGEAIVVNGGTITSENQTILAPDVDPNADTYEVRSTYMENFTYTLDFVADGNISAYLRTSDLVIWDYNREIPSQRIPILPEKTFDLAFTTNPNPIIFPLNGEDEDNDEETNNIDCEIANSSNATHPVTPATTGQILDSALLNELRTEYLNRYNVEQAINGLPRITMAEFIAQVTELELRSDDIRDVSGLNAAKNLERLDLRWTSIRNVSLADLTSLKSLELPHTTCLSLTGLTALATSRHLVDDLHYSTSSRNVSLVGLTSLKSLSLSAPPSDYLGNIYLEGLTSLGRLNIFDNISSISLVGLTNLGAVDFQYGVDNIPNVSVQELPALRILHLNSKNVSHISLNGLPALRVLDVSGNKLPETSFSFTGLTALEHLYFHSNNISNVSPFAELTTLKVLNISGNNISDISSFTRLTNLEDLDISWNDISDISSLTGLTNLKSVKLIGNNISDISPLTGLTNLELVILTDNHISDISPLTGLTNLTVLYLRDNNISDISPLTGLTNLKYLYIERNPLNHSSIHTHIPILQANGVGVLFTPTREYPPVVVETDETPDPTPPTTAEVFHTPEIRDALTEKLSEYNEETTTPLTMETYLAELSSLSLEARGIRNLSGLEEATKLQYLFLSDNDISDMSALASLTELKGLGISRNSISDISALAGATNLLNLWLDDNNILDISALQGLTALRGLYLGGNSIRDITPLTGLTELRHLSLGNNPVSDISALEGLTALTDVDLGTQHLDYPLIYTQIPALQTKGVKVHFTPRVPTALLKVSGDAQSGKAGAALQPFVVEVKDAGGYPFAGVPITFAVTVGDGTLSIEETITDAAGRAQSTLTLGDMETIISVSAEKIPTPTYFTAGGSINTFNPVLRDALAKLLAEYNSSTTTPTTMEGYLASVTRLDLSALGIRDLSGLETATKLEYLSLSENGISDIPDLASLTALQDLVLSKNSITDISALAGLTVLQNLWLDDNNISDVSMLSGLLALKHLYLAGNNITNISPLTKLTALTHLELGTQRLDYASLYTYIPALQARGVDVQFTDRVATVLSKVSGDAPSGKAGAALQPFVVEVKDAEGYPFAGVPVTFFVTAGDGTLSVEETETDADGRAESTLTLGDTDTTVTVSIEQDGIQTTFTARRTREVRNVYEKITGPWLWMIAPTEPWRGGAASTDIDSLAAASGGAVTETMIATQGANEGDKVGQLMWTLGKISATGWDNVNDTVTRIGLGQGDINDHSSYALIILESATSQQNVPMKVGSDDSIKVWLNGKVVHKKPINRGASNFRDHFSVNLQQGDNILLVKVSERGGAWSMFVGVGGEDVTPAYKSLGESPTVRVVEESTTFSDDLENLVLYLPFDEGTGTTATDSSKHQNHGTLHKANWTQGKYGNAVELSGERGGWVEVPDASSLDITDEITLMAWVHPTQFTEEWLRIIVKTWTSDTAPWMVYGLYQQGGSNGKTGFIVSVNGGQEARCGNGPSPQLPLNTWTHLAATYDGIRMKLYYNGELKVETSATGKIDTNDVPLSIGRNSEGDREHYIGLIDEVAIWRVALDATEIKQAMEGDIITEPIAAAAPTLNTSTVIIPIEAALLPNYPNPFNPETWIPYQLAKPADVTVHIYAVNGTLVRTLFLGHQVPGSYQNRSRAAYWDGRNAVGELVASGVYFYTLTAGDFTATRKMLIRK